MCVGWAEWRHVQSYNIVPTWCQTLGCVVRRVVCLERIRVWRRQCTVNETMVGYKTRFRFFLFFSLLLHSPPFHSPIFPFFLPTPSCLLHFPLPSFIFFPLLYIFSSLVLYNFLHLVFLHSTPTFLPPLPPSLRDVTWGTRCFVLDLNFMQKKKINSNVLES